MLTFIDRPNAIAYSTIACSRYLSQQLDERFDLPHVLDQGGEPPPPACAVSLPQGRHQPCALANLSEITGGNPGPLGRADLGPRGTVRVQLAEHVWEAHFFGCCCCSLSLMGWGLGMGGIEHAPELFQPSSRTGQAQSPSPVPQTTPWFLPWLPRNPLLLSICRSNSGSRASFEMEPRNFAGNVLWTFPWREFSIPREG